MRLLIDECLTPKLVTAANDAGFEAHHVAHRGWSGKTDSELFRISAGENFTFVTNNRSDFIGLLDSADLHAGLIVIVPNVRGERQVELFSTALDYAATFKDMINRVIEVDRDLKPRGYLLPRG